MLTNKDLFKGCIDIEELDGGIRPIRFTRKQFSVYEDNAALGLRSRCPSGICIDIETNASYIAFDYNIEGWARDWLYFDVFLNNVFVHTIGCSPIEEAKGSFHYNIPKVHKFNRVTIYLPHLVDIVLYNLRVSYGASIRAVSNYEKNLLCLGDSITQGMDGKYPSSSYPVLLSRFIGANILNQGVGGDVFNVHNLDPSLPFEPDIITVAYGTNDWGLCKSMSEFERNCREYIDALMDMYEECKIFVITPIWRSDINEIKPMGDMQSLKNSIYSICEEYPQIDVIDGQMLVPNMPHFFGDKSVHPSDEGFLHMAINLLRYIMQ